MWSCDKVLNNDMIWKQMRCVGCGRAPLRELTPPESEPSCVPVLQPACKEYMMSINHSH